MKKILQLTSILVASSLWGSRYHLLNRLMNLLKQGDQYVAEFNHQKALDTYNQADKLSPNNWDVLWRISRAYVDLGEKMPD